MKRFLALVLCLLMALSLVACGGKDAPAEEEAPATDAEVSADQPYAGTTIRVILAGHDWTNAIQPKLPEFEAATGIKVEFESYPEDQLSTKLNVELASGGQYIDVFMCRPLQEVQRFIQNGFLAEVNDLLAVEEFQSDDFITAAINGFAYNGADDGKFYGVPLVTERQVLFYRKDLFEAAGIAVPTNLIPTTALPASPAAARPTPPSPSSPPTSTPSALTSLTSPPTPPPSTPRKPLRPSSTTASSLVSTAPLAPPTCTGTSALLSTPPAALPCAPTLTPSGLPSAAPTPTSMRTPASL